MEKKGRKKKKKEIIIDLVPAIPTSRSSLA
jgi:hypothetical protein